MMKSGPADSQSTSLSRPEGIFYVDHCGFEFSVNGCSVRSWCCGIMLTRL